MLSVVAPRCSLLLKKSTSFEGVNILQVFSKVSHFGNSLMGKLFPFLPLSKNLEKR
jgi:hypothetical protein